MGRYLCLSLVILLLCASALALAAEGNKEDVLLRRAEVDSSATFEVGMLLDVFPLDTVMVPLYLHTSNPVTYTENTINWTDADLNLVTVTKGPGVPADTSTVLTILNETDDEVQFKIFSPSPFTIPQDEPIAYLHYEVLCYGYGASTSITLKNDDNYNVYITGGQLFSPLRDNGYIRTADEVYTWELAVIGDFETVYSGDQDIVWEVDLWQQVPGKITLARFLYDPAVLSFDSVSPGPGLGDGTVTAYTSGDTIVVECPETNPPSPTGVQICIFNFHFDLITGDDDFTTNVPVIYSERTDECGGISYPMPAGGWIKVPLHTAEAEIDEISAYTFTSYYYVPFIMDSNFPVNDFEFWVEFPSDDITFVDIVEIAGFASPYGSVDPGTPDILQINNGLNTDYLPSQLPATVFKLKFQPVSTPSVGDVFNLVFYASGQNEVRYAMELGGYHTADPLTLTNGSIEIIQYNDPDPDPGCPTLYVWNGRSYVRDNTILAACDGANISSDITDYYLVSETVAAGPDLLRFQVREDAQEISSFSDFQLQVVDHPENRPIQVNREGKIITVGQPFSLSWAKDHKGNDVTKQIAVEDGIFFVCEETGWLNVSFGRLSKAQIGSFVAEQGIKPKDEPKDRDALSSSGRDQENMSKKLNISIQTKDGSWKLISQEDARFKQTRQATIINPELIDPSRELVLRYSWEGYYRTDAIGFNRAEPFEGEIEKLTLAMADHNENGMVLHRLGTAAPDQPVTLSSGEAIELAFDAGSLPPLAEGEVRDYIFLSKGFYRKPGAPKLNTEFVLEPNVPNPFNPTTRIRYHLPKSTQVELKVYDVRGALVRTLVSEFQMVGQKEVPWDARSDAGEKMASGVYFYQLKTPEFVQTRKMILLK